MASDRERFARIALSFVAEPGDVALGALLRACGPAGLCLIFIASAAGWMAAPNGG